MEIQDAINKAILIFEQNKDDWEMSEISLRNSGVPMPLVEKILEFTPLAFGRMFLNGLGITFSDEYVRYMVIDNKVVEKYRGKLIDEPVFNESLRIAADMVSKGEIGEGFQAILFSGAEFRAVNNALNNGSQPQDLVLSDPVLHWKE